MDYSPDFIQCYRDTGGTCSRAAVFDQSGLKEKEERALHCKHCLSRITTQAAAVEKEGRHEHTFYNPAGVVFRIGCFSEAQGCLPEGEPTSAFTWFSEYAWQVAYCAQCRMQLGWFYQSGRGSFWGLILDHLIQGMK